MMSTSSTAMVICAALLTDKRLFVLMNLHMAFKRALLTVTEER